MEIVGGFVVKTKRKRKRKRKKKRQAKNKAKIETQTSRLNLLARRSVYLNGPLTEELAAGVVEEVRDLLQKNSEEPVYLCIDTVGGDEAAAHGLCNYLRDFLRLKKLVTVMLRSVDHISIILFMSAHERIMAKDLVLDIVPSKNIGFNGGNGASNGTQKPLYHPLAILSKVSGRISAMQALEAGIATGLI